MRAVCDLTSCPCCASSLGAAPPAPGGRPTTSPCSTRACSRLSRGRGQWQRLMATLQASSAWQTGGTAASPNRFFCCMHDMRVEHAWDNPFLRKNYGSRSAFLSLRPSPSQSQPGCVQALPGHKRLLTLWYWRIVGSFYSLSRFLTSFLLSKLLVSVAKEKRE